MHAKCLEQCLWRPTCSFQVSFTRSSISSISQMCWSLEHLSVVPEGQKKRECCPDYNSGSCLKNHISDTWMKKIGINLTKRRGLRWLAYWAQVAYGHHGTKEVGFFCVAREVGTRMRMGTMRLPEQNPMRPQEVEGDRPSHTSSA